MNSPDRVLASCVGPHGNAARQKLRNGEIKLKSTEKGNSTLLEFPTFQKARLGYSLSDTSKKNVAKVGLSSSFRVRNSRCTGDVTTSPASTSTCSTNLPDGQQSASTCSTNQDRSWFASALHKQTEAHEDVVPSSLAGLSTQSSAWPNVQAESLEGYGEGELREDLQKARQLLDGACRVGPVEGASREDHEDLTWLHVVTGKIGKTHPTTAGMIITIFALLGTVSLSLHLVGTSYGTGFALLAIGILYLVLPIDLIPDDYRGWAGIRFGLADDLVLGGGSIIVGVGLLLKTYLNAPIDVTPCDVLILLALLLVLIIGCVNPDLRMFFVGIWGMFGQFTFFCDFIDNPTLAFGVGCYFFGFIYNALPRDILPNGIFVFRVFGKVHDYALGYLPLLAGVFLMATAIASSLVFA